MNRLFINKISCTKLYNVRMNKSTNPKTYAK